ncbi:hypothetical protein A2U01_0097582, partial [Trifolium medium]|nr:hypothetical protein [Trifolium medium]
MSHVSERTSTRPDTDLMDLV